MDNSEKFAMLGIFRSVHKVFGGRDELKYEIDGTTFKLVSFEKEGVLHFYITKLQGNIELRVPDKDWMDVLAKIKEKVMNEFYEQDMDYEAGM